MKAARIHEYGKPSVLRYEEAPMPEASDDQMLVRVHAAGINPIDAKRRAGERLPPELPAILGRDVSGVVEQAGSKVRDFQNGDEVFGMLAYDHGSYAEYAVAASLELAKKPAGLDHLHAGSIGVAALTAWQAVFDHGELRNGQRVLIQGGAGGVGHFAVQFAAAAGAEAIATASAKDLEFVRSLGASRAIDYKSERFEDEVRDVDLVIDLVGGQTRERSWKVLKPGGLIVSTLGEPKPPGDAPKDVGGRGMVVEVKSDQLHEIASRAASGKLRIEISKVFSLGEAVQAHEFLEHEHFRGKIVFAVRK